MVSEGVGLGSAFSAGDLVDSGGTSAAGDLLGSAGACARARTDNVKRNAKTRRSRLNGEKPLGDGIQFTTFNSGTNAKASLMLAYGLT
jgi:hypothetical protein